jgi:hypothetical protein
MPADRLSSFAAIEPSVAVTVAMPGRDLVKHGIARSNLSKDCLEVRQCFPRELPDALRQRGGAVDGDLAAIIVEATCPGAGRLNVRRELAVSSCGRWITGNALGIPNVVVVGLVVLAGDRAQPAGPHPLRSLLGRYRRRRSRRLRFGG